MPNPLMPMTRGQIRQTIGGLLNQVEQFAFSRLPFTAVTSTTITIPRLKAMPSDSGMFNGTSLYLPGATDASDTNVQYVDTGGFDRDNGKLTITPGWSPSPSATNGIVELYRKWSRQEIDSAIDTAFLDGAGSTLIDHSSVPLAMHSSLYSGTQQRDYPIPYEYLWLSHVGFDINAPLANHALSSYDGHDLKLDQDASTSSWKGLVFGYAPAASTWLYAFSVPAYRVGNPVYGLQATISSGSSVDNIMGTSDISVVDARSVPTDPTLICFMLNRPVRLAQGTNYRFKVKFSRASQSTSNYIAFPYDGAGTDTTDPYGTNYVMNIAGDIVHIYDPDQSSADNGLRISPIYYLYGLPSWQYLKPDDWRLLFSANRQFTNDSGSFESWEEVRVEFDPVRFQVQDAHLVRLGGARGPTDFTRWRYEGLQPSLYTTSGNQSSTPPWVDMDTVIPELDPMFIVYKAASLLAEERITGQSVTIEDYRSQAQMWGALAERKRPTFTLPYGAARKVR